MWCHLLYQCYRKYLTFQLLWASTSNPLNNFHIRYFFHKPDQDEKLNYRINQNGTHTKVEEYKLYVILQ